MGLETQPQAFGCIRSNCAICNRQHATYKIFILKIAFFVQYSDKNGTFFRWHNLAIALKQQGLHVDVYASDHNWRNDVRIEIIDNVNYHIVPSLVSSKVFHNPNDPFSGVRRLFHLPKTDYDVYHLFQPFLHAFIPWWYLSRKKKSIFVYDWDDLWIGGFINSRIRGWRDLYYNKYISYVEKKSQQLAAGTTVCSDFLLSRVVTPKPKTIIHNGFWPQKPSNTKEYFRRKWSFDDSFYLAYIGKTAGEMDWIIDAYQITSKTKPKTKLIICGPPKSLLDNYSIDSDPGIIYLGEVSPTDASEIAQASDLGLIPLEDTPFNQSRFPIKFLDFLSVGTPVYLSDVGEIARISSGLAGVFKGVGSKAEWITGLNSVIGNVTNSKYPVDIRSIEDSLSWPAIAAKLQQFYHQLKLPS